MDWKKLYKQGLDSTIKPVTVSDFIRKYCFKLRRKNIQDAIKHHMLCKHLSDGEKFGLYAAMGGCTKYYRTLDFDYIKRVFVYFRLWSEAKLGEAEAKVFEAYKSALKNEKQTISFKTEPEPVI